MWQNYNRDSFYDLHSWLKIFIKKLKNVQKLCSIPEHMLNEIIITKKT